MTKPRSYVNATKYESSPTQIKNREARNQARSDMIKAGKAHVGDKRDVGHKRALDNGGARTTANTEMQSIASNRGWRKNRKGYSVPNI